MEWNLPSAHKQVWQQTQWACHLWRKCRLLTSLLIRFWDGTSMTISIVRAYLSIKFGHFQIRSSSKNERDRFTIHLAFQTFEKSVVFVIFVGVQQSFFLIPLNSLWSIGSRISESGSFQEKNSTAFWANGNCILSSLCGKKAEVHCRFKWIHQHFKWACLREVKVAWNWSVSWELSNCNVLTFRFCGVWTIKCRPLANMQPLSLGEWVQDSVRHAAAPWNKRSPHTQTLHKRGK